MPKFGDVVRVRPRPGLRVQRGEHLFDSFLPDEGMEVIWDSYHHARLQDGSILLPAAHYHAARIDSAIGEAEERRAALPASDDKGRAAIDEQIKALREQRSALDKPAAKAEADAPAAVPDLPRMPRTTKKEIG